jgi:hypothetical protein
MNQTDSRFVPENEHFLPVRADTLSEIESKIGATLPPEYVLFVTTYGGCGFSGNGVVICNNGEFPIFSFFDDKRLISKILWYEDLTREKKFAIADDMMGNPYILDALNGCVYFLEFCSNPPIGTEIAKDFTNFLMSIRVEPYE